ncbi:MAG: hypothetical protein WCX71_04490 [Candidatus Buchananbacteria bacterium]
MKMNWNIEWNVTNVAILAVALVIGVAWLPTITLVVGLVLFFLFRSKELKENDKGWQFGSALFSSLFVAAITQIVLSWFFGASLKDVVSVDGLAGIIMNPAALSLAVAKEVFVLIVVYCVGLLWFKSTAPKLWLYKVAIVFTICYLGYQEFDAYAPVDVRVSSRLRSTTAMARSTAVSWLQSKLFEANSKVKKSADIKMMVGSADYLVVTITDDVPLCEKSGQAKPGFRFVESKLDEKTKEKIGQQWLVMLERRFSSTISDLEYIELVSRRDESIIRYIRQDYLNDVINVAESAAKTSEDNTAAMATKPAAPSTHNTPPTPSSASTPTPTAVPAKVAVQEGKKRVQFTATSKWYDTGVVLKPGQYCNWFSTDFEPLEQSALESLEFVIAISEMTIPKSSWRPAINEVAGGYCGTCNVTDSNSNNCHLFVRTNNGRTFGLGLVVSGEMGDRS